MSSQSSSAAAIPDPLILSGAWSGMLTQRPRLLGPVEHLRKLAAGRPELYREVTSQDNLVAAGLTRMVERRDDEKTLALAAKHIDVAKQNVARAVTNVHQDTWIWLQQVVQTYDFFYDLIPASQRQEMIDWLNPHLEAFRDDQNPFHNSILPKMCAYMQIAVATHGENPRAQAFRDYAVETLYKGLLLPVLLEFGAGGGWTECGWYCRGALWFLVAFLELARRVDGFDGYQLAPSFYYHRMAYDMLQPYPGLWQDGYERYSCEGDGHNQHSQAMEFPQLVRMVLAQYFRGSELSRYIQGCKRNVHPNFRIWQFLYEEDAEMGRGGDAEKQKDEEDQSLTSSSSSASSVPSVVNSSSFPLSHLSRGIGKLHARGGWDDDATWLRFECGHFFNQHQHHEAGNFEIFRRQPLATESGEYSDWHSPHALNWLIRTVAHNCILVYQEGEKFLNIRNWQGAEMANDGGQANFVYVSHSLEQWHRQRADHERGHVFAFQDMGPVLYVAGDCTKAYAASKVSLCRRHIVFMRPHRFIILDRVTSVKPDYAKTWLLHCMNEPAIDGRTTTITNGAGKLTVQTLQPHAASIAKMEGYTYGGQTFEAAKGKLNATAERWRIEVRPDSPATEDIFLHYLSTEDSPGMAEMVRDGDAIGARGDDWQVLLDPSGNGVLTMAGAQYELAAEVRVGKYET